MNYIECTFNKWRISILISLKYLLGVNLMDIVGMDIVLTIKVHSFSAVLQAVIETFVKLPNVEPEINK